MALPKMSCVESSTTKKCKECEQFKRSPATIKTAWPVKRMNQAIHNKNISALAVD